MSLSRAGSCCGWYLLSDHTFKAQDESSYDSCFSSIIIYDESKKAISIRYTDGKHAWAVTWGEDKIKNIFMASGPMASDKKTPSMHDKHVTTPPMGKLFQDFSKRA